MADNAHEATSDLQTAIDALRSLGSLAEDVAPKCAKALKVDIEAQIAAGKAPDGTPWQLTADGKVPLRNAAKALRVTSERNVVIARLDGPEALHHHGTAAGGIKRQILPTRKIPDSAVRAVRQILVDETAKRLGGG